MHKLHPVLIPQYNIYCICGISYVYNLHRQDIIQNYRLRVIQSESAISSGVEVAQSVSEKDLSADILIALLFKKQWCYIFSRGRATPENVPSTPGVAVMENQGLLHCEERHSLFKKIRSGDAVVKVFFQ